MVTQERKAELYLTAYNNYLDIQGQIIKLEELKKASHRVLCEAAGIFLGLDESEIEKIIFYWTSIAEDAERVLKIKNEGPSFNG